MGRIRWWSASLYVLATVLARWGHTHHGRPDSAARCEASCADSRTHLSGHSAPDTHQDRADCLACQYRAEPHCWLISQPIFLPPFAAIRAIEATSLSSPQPLRRASCRAPPRV